MCGKYFWNMTLTRKLMVENLIGLFLFAKPNYMKSETHFDSPIDSLDMTWSLPVPPGIRSKVPWVACWMQLPSSLGVLRLGGIFGKKRRCHQFLMGDFDGGVLVTLWCFSRVKEWMIQSTMSVGSQVVRQAVFPCFPYLLPAAVDPVCFRCCHICLSSLLSLGSRFVIGQPIFDLVWMD